MQVPQTAQEILPTLDQLPQTSDSGSVRSNRGSSSHSDDVHSQNENKVQKDRQPIMIDGEEYHQSRGVERMEAVARYAKHGGRTGRWSYYLIGASVLVCMFVVSWETLGFT